MGHLEGLERGRDGCGEEEREIGVARFSAAADVKDCEFAVNVSDELQRKGLRTLLMPAAREVAQSRGIRSLYSNDAPMCKFAEHPHLRHEREPGDAAQVRYSVDLGAPRLGNGA